MLCVDWPVKKISWFLNNDCSVYENTILSELDQGNHNVQL